MKNNYLGKGYYKCKSRIYKRIWKGNSIGKLILVSWIDKHCKLCGRFVSKKNKSGYCKKCFNKERWKKYREYRKLYQRIYGLLRRRELLKYYGLGVK